MLSTVRAARSGRFQDGEDGRGPAEEEQSAAVCGNVLVATRAEAEKVSELVVPAAEPGRGPGTLETPHGSTAAFQAAVILFQPVIGKHEEVWGAVSSRQCPIGRAPCPGGGLLQATPHFLMLPEPWAASREEGAQCRQARRGAVLRGQAGEPRPAAPWAAPTPADPSGVARVPLTGAPRPSRSCRWRPA